MLKKDPDKVHRIHHECVKKFGSYTLMKEYERMGLLDDGGLRVVRSSTDLHPHSPSSYPEELIEPAGMTNDELKKVCGFRSKGRIPSITYIHPVTRALMSRR